jgi:hypothetical protein
MTPASLIVSAIVNGAEVPGHPDFSIVEFRDMKMQPSLECAVRHKDILKA